MGCEADFVVNLKDSESWMMFENSNSGFLYEGSLEVAALYDYGYWLIIVAGWTMFISIFIVIEIMHQG